MSQMVLHLYGANSIWNNYALQGHLLGHLFFLARLACHRCKGRGFIKI